MSQKVKSTALKNKVESFGGFDSVEENEKWEEVSESLGLKKSDAKKIRAKYIEIFKSSNEKDDSKSEESGEENGGESGKIQYLVKWEGYDDSQNSWVPANEMYGCDELVEEFEENHNSSKKRKLKEEEEKPKKQVKKNEKDEKNANITNKEPENSPEKQNSETDDLKSPKKILGAKMKDGELCFFVEWADQLPLSWVPAKIANVKYPQLVISFYESRLIFDFPPTAKRGKKGGLKDDDVENKISEKDSESKEDAMETEPSKKEQDSLLEDD